MRAGASVGLKGLVVLSDAPNISRVFVNAQLAQRDDFKLAFSRVFTALAWSLTYEKLDKNTKLK